MKLNLPEYRASARLLWLQEGWEGLLVTGTETPWPYKRCLHRSVLRQALRAHAGWHHKGQVRNLSPQHQPHEEGGLSRSRCFLQAAASVPCMVYRTFKFRLARILKLFFPPFSLNSCNKIGPCYPKAGKAMAVSECALILDLSAHSPGPGFLERSPVGAWREPGLCEPHSVQPAKQCKLWALVSTAGGSS